MVKAEEFIKNKWYKTYKIQQKVYAYYIKFSSVNRNYVESSDFINYEHKNHSYCNTSDSLESTIFTLIDISEIIPFLPLNHPDRKNQINDVISNIVIW